MRKILVAIALLVSVITAFSFSGAQTTSAQTSCTISIFYGVAPEYRDTSIVRCRTTPAAYYRNRTGCSTSVTASPGVTVYGPWRLSQINTSASSAKCPSTHRIAKNIFVEWSY